MTRAPATRFKPVAKLIPYARNARTHSPAQIAEIAASITEFGFTNPVLEDDEGIVAGHGRALAAALLYGEGKRIKLPSGELIPDGTVPILDCTGWTKAQRRAYIIADNQLALGAGWNAELLKIELQDLRSSDFDVGLLGFPDADLRGWLDEEAPTKPKPPTLADRFLVPPFTVLNARDGWWQDRKREWLAIGIESELGRGQGLTLQSEQVTAPSLNYYRDKNAGKAKQHVAGVLMKSDSGNDPRYYAKKQEAEARLGRTLTTEEFQRDHYTGPESYESGTSIFDPVLCELTYRWFSPPDGVVLDPFAGGSVRGIVAGMLGRRYVGQDLRPEQITENERQAAALLPEGVVRYIAGDSRTIDQTAADVDADLVFTCPPYADLERYSDDPRDISTMTYRDFLAVYREIVAKACARLRSHRFAVCVVGEVRDREGNYLDFVGDTVQAFRDAGLFFYNEAILVTQVGSLPIRAARQFSAGRKLGKTHQNVLVFVKGDGKKATKACGPVSVDVEDHAIDPEPERDAPAGDGVRVKISAKSARLEFAGCSPEYIATTCHASCCQSSVSPTGTVITIHPREEEAIRARGGVIVDGLLQPRPGERRCPFKTEADLCGLHQTPDKPFGCIASPFTLNPSGTLIVRNRYRMLKCFKDGARLPAYVAFRASLDLIFGAEESARIVQHLVDGGGDIEAVMPRASYETLRTNDQIKASNAP